MPNVADFIVVRDGKAKLQLVGPGGAKFWNFNVPSNTVTTQRSVLTFMMWRIEDADKLKMSVVVNNKTVFNFNVSGTHRWPAAISEVMPSKILKAGSGKPNTIMFIKNSGGGYIDFSDVVIWLQVQA